MVPPFRHQACTTLGSDREVEMGSLRSRVGRSIGRVALTAVMVACAAAQLGTTGGCAANKDEHATSESAQNGAPGEGLVISQLYTSGGLAGATFRRDYVEIFNASNAPKSLDGLSLQVAADADALGAAEPVSLPGHVVLQPGTFFLFGLGGAEAKEGKELPAAALDVLPNDLPSAGKIALVRGASALLLPSKSLAASPQPTRSTMRN